MNRSALKNYAPKARLDFIRAVTDRAAFFGLTPDRTEPIQETGDVVIIGGRAFPRVVAEQRKKLQERINQHGFDQVMEAMAYTWFNRFVALRYMELHGYLDHGYRVLSHPEGKPTPEILEHAEHVTLPGLDAQQVINLKLDGSREAELYRLLLVAQCNALHEAMPFLFEKIADETELLLPDNLLHSDSIIRKLVNELDEADWQKVEIIGWLYQFYISDKKDEVIGKVVKSEDIPAATQLFTPNWIVKYLVQNTLGRQWLATYPDSPLRQQMEYYIEPAEQTEEVKAQLAAITPKSLNPETLTLLDPASGSGHILVEAYDLFKAIYQERGYRSKDIPRLILEKNLFGLEIDDRAAQLAAFALLMKARADDRRIFADHVQPNVLAIQESKGLESLLTPGPAAAAVAGDLPFTDSDMFPDMQKQLTLSRPAKGSPLAAVEPCLRGLIKLFEHGKTFGSLIRIAPSIAAQLPAARQSVEVMIAKGQLWEHRVGTLLLPLVRQADLLARTYDSVVANPPYMTSDYMPGELKAFIQRTHHVKRTDLYALFLERGLELLGQSGFLGMITRDSWMFLPTYEQLRIRLLASFDLVCLAHLGPQAFDTIGGHVVQTTMFSVSKRKRDGYRPTFHRLVKGNHVDKNDALLERRHSFSLDQREFAKIPAQPLVYWVGNSTRDAFAKNESIGAHAELREGIHTGKNEQFLRFWWEVNLDKFSCSETSYDSIDVHDKKWIPYNKGGEFRKWFGNNVFVIAFDAISRATMETLEGHVRPSEHLYFREGATWTDVGSGSFGARYYPNGFLFDGKGMAVVSSDIHYLLALMNSSPIQFFADLVMPTLNFKCGTVKKLPFAEVAQKEVVKRNAEMAVAVAQGDWDAQERSWNFQKPPHLTSPGTTIEQSQKEWALKQSLNRNRILELEEENNRVFIAAFSVGTEVGSQSSPEQVTLETPDREQDMQRLVSYAIGCMMGRYSLDKPGLVYAHSRNEGFDPGQYRTFAADADGIIPVTELAWFPDDATERFVEFISKAWPREHLEENLKFIADSLGPNRDEHPRDTIRHFLATGFYKDHLQTYKRRPIYWLFSSGKQRAFQCLVYLHRYHDGTLARMRTEYVIPLQGKMSHRIEQLAGDITAATSTSHRRKLEKEKEHLVKQSTELAAFDEKLRHYADQRIALDLDNGVKVNYGKFGDLLAEVKAITGGTEE